MLFYNHKQEFIGIDEDGLRLLNYESLTDLLDVCSDVADLFAKEPGYIHNFKNFGWIDFLLHADSDATSAIVHANGRTFSCTLQVHKLFLCETPAQNGYMIEMLHVQSMSGETIRPHTITPKAAPISRASYEAAPKPAEAPMAETAFIQPGVSGEPAPSVLPDYGYLTPTPLSEPGVLDVPSYEESEFEPLIPEPQEERYEKLTLPGYEETVSEPYPQAPAQPETAAVAPSAPKAAAPLTAPSGALRFSPEEQRFIDELKVDPSYRFDPTVAANELGLPVDLIEEFIGDFIQQSHDFKEELFDAAAKGDMNNLKILSHKLKGVAANLRIEDAFECLAIINTSDDIIQIEANLKYFYAIIDKLEGKEPQAATDAFAAEEPRYEEPAYPSEAIDTAPSFEEPAAPTYNLDDDIYAFGFKEETPAETAAPAAAEAPDYGFGLKHEENDSLIVHEEDLSAPAADAEIYDFAFEPELPAEKAAFETPSSLSSAEELPGEAAAAPLHYDKSAIAGQLGIERTFLDELIDDYKHEALRNASRISDAIGAFDTHLWQDAAKELKGISDNLRLMEISDELSILSTTNDAQEANKASKRLNGYLEQL